MLCDVDVMSTHIQALEEESTMTPEQLALKNVGKQVCPRLETMYPVKWWEGKGGYREGGRAREREREREGGEGGREGGRGRERERERGVLELRMCSHALMAVADTGSPACNSYPSVIAASSMFWVIPT